MSESKRTITEDLAVERTSLAADRTVMAAERTFMAWTRTSLSLISFGFTMYKFLEYTREGSTALAGTPTGPRNLGLTLIGLGVLFLVLASVEHWKLLNSLAPRKRMRSWRLSLFLAGLLAVLGILAMINVIFKVGPF